MGFAPNTNSMTALKDIPLFWKRLCPIGLIFPITLLLTQCGLAQNTKNLRSLADQHLVEMEKHLYATSDSIWDYSEPSFNERQTVNLLKKQLLAQGFGITDSIAEYETMFIASYGAKGPVICFLAEADADSPLTPKMGFHFPDSNHGQAAGHHLLATGSLGATLALKELIKQGKLDAQLRYVFSTAEGSLGGRVPLAQQSFFSDVDLAFFWHPAPVTSANLSKWDAILDMEILYPSTDEVQKNIRALWATLDSIKQGYGPNLLMRTKIKNTAFDVAIPEDSLKIHLRIEHVVQEKAVEIYKRIADTLQLQRNPAPHWTIFRAVHGFIPNLAGNRRAYTHLDRMPSRKIHDSDLMLALKIWSAANKQEGRFLHDLLPFRETRSDGLYGYGSDIGDVSWQVPLISIVTSCLPTGISMRNWEGTAFGQTQYAKDGMLEAARAMVFTAIDYLTDKELQQQISMEFEQRLQNRTYFRSIEILPNEASLKKRSY